MAGEKILVVDDSRNIREIFTFAFDEYDIVTAGDAEEAARLLDKPHDIDLVVLDVMLPDKNGMELLREIKEKNPDCRVIMMTGYSSKDIAIEALRRQADDYLEKPFDIEAAREMVKRQLEKGRCETTAQHGAGDKVESARRLVERNFNRPIFLQDISRDLFLNYKYLSRIFKERTGRSFNDYRVALRVASAKELLAGTGLTVSQIAYRVGYRNPNSFMKIFKQCAGCTPSEFREKRAHAGPERKKAGGVKGGDRREKS